MTDPYKTLGVAKTATADEIKSAFRKLAKKYHPDANRDDPKAQERFATVSRAYEIIGDAEKRKKFDRGEIDAEGREAFSGGGYPGGNPFAGFEQFDFGARRSGRRQQSAGFDPEDILNTMFGAGFGGGRGQAGGGPDFSSAFGAGGPNRQTRAQPQKGKDIEVPLRLTAADIFSGHKARVSLPDGRTLSVSLPETVEDGQIIRLKGQGAVGQAGHRGDVLARIVFSADDTSRIAGHNVIIEIDVPLKTAIRGGKVPVMTADGKIALKIAPGANSGHVMRIKGRGLTMKDGKRGDLIARLRIVLDDGDHAALDAFYSMQAQK